MVINGTAATAGSDDGASAACGAAAAADDPSRQLPTLSQQLNCSGYSAYLSAVVPPAWASQPGLGRAASAAVAVVFLALCLLNNLCGSLVVAVFVR